MNALLTLLALGVANPPAAPLHCPIPLGARGEVKAGAPLSHTFDLTHIGSVGTLCITRVEAGCGCLRQTLSANRLQPGETAKLTIEVNTLTQPDGPNRWQVQVSYTLDLPPVAPGAAPVSQSGSQLLNVTANLSREVSVVPPQLAFSCTAEAAGSFTITDRRTRPLTVVKAASTSPHLLAEIGKPAAGADGTRQQVVHVKLVADAPTGHRDETLTLYTDDAAYPELRLPVRVLKRGANGVTATPDAVALRFAQEQDEVSALVQLRATDSKAIQVVNAESDDPSVKVKWSPGSGSVAAVRITVARTAGKPTGSSIVRVRLLEPVGQDVMIPISWTDGGK